MIKKALQNEILYVNEQKKLIAMNSMQITTVRMLSRFSTRRLSSCETIFSLVVRALGSNQLKIYSIFTIARRFV